MRILLQVEDMRLPMELTEAGVIIGRGEGADIRVGSHSVSRIHARVFLREGQVWVVDRHSLNGTRLNDRPVTKPTLMHPDDVAHLGEVPVRWSALPPEPAPEAPGLPASAMPSASPRIHLEDLDFDPEVSILVPHASLEAMLDRYLSQPARPEATLFQRLASMAGKLLGAANLKDLLDSVMTLATTQIQCQRGFILLNSGTGDLAPACGWEEQPGRITAPISRTIARKAMTDRVAILTIDARIDPRFAAGESIKTLGISSALCAPLVVEEQALGVIYLETSLSQGGFKREDEHLLSAMANFAAVGIQRDRETRFRQRLERYHSPQVVEEILRATQDLDAPILQAKRCEISVLFADLSNFTRFSETMEPLALASLLNRTFEAMTEQVFRHGGTLDKYTGDGLMAFFGAPAADPNHASHAVAAAVAMQRCLDRQNEHRLPGQPQLSMRIGINSGEAFAGDLGCEKRMDYTVLGATVNLASRLEEFVAQPGTVVVGPRTAELVGGLTPMAATRLKGLDHDIQPFLVPWKPGEERAMA